MARRSNTPSASGRRRRDDGNKKPLIIAAIVVILAGIAWYSYKTMFPNKHHLPYDGVVQSVDQNGTLILKNGLKVQLLGITANNRTIEFLNANVIGKNVHLIADSHDTKPYFTHASTDLVRSYVTVTENVEYKKLNGYLLRKQLAMLNDGYCQDSIAAYRSYVNYKDKDTLVIDPGHPAPNGPFTKQTLFKYMAPSTFLIQTESERGTSIGTGFFINENGLALTNYHVLAGASTGRVFLCDEKGNITADRDRNILRIVQYSSKYDWCIFVVSLDPGEKSPYLKLARQRPERGVDVGVVGNPRGLLATYTTGQVTNIHEDAGKIQIDASMTQGNSGGPICNFNGEVVGIAQSVAGNSDGSNATGNLNFGTDIMIVRNALDQLKDVKTYGGK